MKLIVMADDETWFWVWDEEQMMWICFYENGDRPAVHCAFNDCARTEEVIERMRGIMAGVSQFIR